MPGAFYWSVRGVHAAAPLFVALGNLESAHARGTNRDDERVDRPVYICGLPRAGTTITLQMLSEHPDVATHKYADFLMPYMPYVWNRVFPRIPVDAMRKPVPRIHRDRIQVTRDSAEMGEEILWEHFFPYIHEESNYSVLDGTTSNPAFERFYSEHLHQTRARARPSALRQQSDHVRHADAVPAQDVPRRALSALRSQPASITSPRLLKQDRIWAEIESATTRGRSRSSN